ARGRYIEFCKSTIPSRLDFRGLKVVVDCAHGATYHIAPDVLEEIGAEVIAIGAEPNGLNINEGFGATKPRALASSVRVNGAHLGIALDGDGDRVIMVDETGEVVDGDEILYIIARSRLTNGGLQGSVVGTHMSNLGLEVALRDLGVGFERVAVGDRYILERLSEQDWTLGGEASGHIICRDRTTTGDGIVSALQVLAEINKTGKTLGELRSGMVKFPQELINVPLGGARAADVMASKAVVDAVRSVESTMGADGRVLLRPSGTEPLIRVMVEGREAAVVTSNANAIAEAVRHLVAA
ncbi:MAG TPA: phosphoglucosamine mutase, partial [Gammaproteobacteria bacterium]|nr:phosphoglucosamine mutase [Gammaproteobacteria bacterium]